MTDFNAMQEALVSCDKAKSEDLVNTALAGEIGADGFAPDAGSASKMAKTLEVQNVR